MDFPPFQVVAHETVFGGIRDDVLVVKLQESLHSACSLEDFIAKIQISISPELLATLVAYGAIYVTRCFPLNRAMAFQQKKSDTGATEVHRCTKRYRPSSDKTLWCLPPGTQEVRFHLIPQTFDRTSRISWTKRLLLEDGDFCWINKPAGLPCEPVASNYLECLHVQAGQAYCKDLHPIHRIDLWATGVVCLGKSKEAIKKFNALKSRKFYQLLVGSQNGELQPKEGIMEHWMPPGSCFRLAAPRLLRTSATPTWKRCLSRVLRVEPIPYDALKVSDEDPIYAKSLVAEFEALRNRKCCLYHIDVELITGRTHQLRAQCAAMGYPIVCDTLYGPFANVTVDHLKPSRITSIDLHALVVLKQAYEGPELTTDEQDILQRLLLTRLPSSPLGMQVVEA